MKEIFIYFYFIFYYVTLFVLVKSNDKIKLLNNSKLVK